LQQLRARILSGEFSVDEEMPPEGTLAATLGVSRTVIREAMRSLRAQGLVAVSQGRRPRVRPADPQATVESLAALLQRSEGSLLHLIEVRRPVESEIACLAAQRASDDQTERMAGTIVDQLAASDLEERIAADMRFHNLLAEATGNPIFRMLMATIWGLMRQSLSATISRTGVERAVQGHRLVLEAVRQHDRVTARAAMLDHLQMAEQDLLGGDTP
jgi:GntR family transcriptional repressor for pyruvate dehydrogenase complex